MKTVCLYLLPLFLCCSTLSIPAEEHRYSKTNASSISRNDAAEKLHGNKEQPDSFIPVRSGIVINGNATIQFFLSGESHPSIVRELDQSIFSTPVDITHTKIREDYTIYFKSDGFITAYKFQQTKKTWNQARKICAEEGAFLAYPTSAIEEAEFQKLKSINKADYIWVGMHDLFEEGDWTTVLGESLKEMSYVNWREGEPNNHKLEENCAELYMNGMNDVLCNQPRPYICKIHVKY